MSRRGGRDARHRAQRRSAFTLIEVMLAMLVIGIGLLVMLTAASRCLAVVSNARFFEEARHLLEILDVQEMIVLEELEEGLEQGTFKEPYEGYRWEREVLPASEDEEYRLFIVNTRIIRDGEGTRPLTEEVSTLLYAPLEEEGTP